MTISEFLEELKQVKCTWFLKNGMIRTFYDTTTLNNLYIDCPITATAQHKGYKNCGSHLFDKSAQFLGLELKDTCSIIYAADNRKDVGNFVILRKQLEEACKL